MIGFLTLDVGQQALIYDLDGKARIEEGPNRLFLWRCKMQILQPYTANQNKYLIVKWKNGDVKHIQGPVTMFKNPLEHRSITLEDCISLDANEVLVVYSHDTETRKVRRYIQHGPTLFMRGANEWLHEFKWHGTDPENKTRKTPGSLVFTKLQVIPDQFYYNVPEVRTADDALIRVKLMLFYELKNIEQMLNATQDPMADFINCLEADVVAFASKLTYMEFIDQAAQLNELENYPQLTGRCKAIGYEVSKVVFRGYYASPVLQSMHDDTIMSRNRLKIAYETAEQEQDIIDENLKNELQRVQVEQEMELERIRHEQAIARTEQEHKLKMLKDKENEKMKTMVKESQSELEAKKFEANQQVQHYNRLSDLEIDLNKVILSQNPQPNKVTRIVNDSKSTAVHLHQQES